MNHTSPGSMPDPLQETTLTGWRFDGQTSVRQAVSLRINADNSAWLLGQAHVAQPLAPSSLRLEEAFEQAPLLVHLPDGSHVELADAREAREVLLKAGAQAATNDGMAAGLARDKRTAITALVFLASVIAAFYVWLLPTLAEVGAGMVPASVSERIGDMALEQLDESLFTPTKLPQAQRDQIEGRFDQLVKGRREHIMLHFRSFSKGPNAIALPGNQIVLTDELVEFVKGDLDVIMGVLAHELGHIEHNHGLRSLIQASALTVLGAAVIGDYSSILATIPAALGHLRYSREFETQADTYSHSLQCAKGLDPAKTAEFFERIEKDSDDMSGLLPNYLSSHPDSVRRAQFFRSKC